MSSSAPPSIPSRNPFARSDVQSLVSQKTPENARTVETCESVYKRYCEENKCYSHLVLGYSNLCTSRWNKNIKYSGEKYFATTTCCSLRIHDAENKGEMVDEIAMPEQFHNYPESNYVVVFNKSFGDKKTWIVKHYIVTHLEEKQDRLGNGPFYSVYCFDPLIQKLTIIKERINHPLIEERRLIAWSTNPDNSSCIDFYQLKSGFLRAKVKVSPDLWGRIAVTSSKDAVLVSNDLSNQSGPFIKFNKFGEWYESSFTYGGMLGRHIDKYLSGTI